MSDKLPLHGDTVRSVLSLLTSHDVALRDTNKQLLTLLQSALDSSTEEMAELPWFEDAFKLIKQQNQLRTEQENDAFFIRSREGTKEATATIQNINKMHTFNPDLNQVRDLSAELALEQERNKAESELGDELTQDEIAEYFKSKPKKSKSINFDKMTLEEIDEWEKKQDNSNDIYKVKARVANLARGSNASLTQVGEMMVNTFVHVLLALYAFAETIEDKDTKIKLIEIIRKQEGMPGNLINAASAGVKANE